MEREVRPGPARHGPRHHIAAVAHHFLAEQDGADGPSRPPAVIVAAADILPMTAFVAAGAARTGAVATTADWTLLEDDAAPWSAGSHLARDTRVLLQPASGFCRDAAAGRGFCWHLGRTSAAGLDAWGAAAGLPGCDLPTAGRRSHLFWCVAADTAAALAPLGLLARLAALAAPERVDLIVAPRSWPYRNAGAGAAAAPDDRCLPRLRARAAELCGQPVRLGVVRPGMGTAGAAALVTEFLHTAAAAAGA